MSAGIAAGGRIMGAGATAVRRCATATGSGARPDDADVLRERVGCERVGATARIDPAGSGTRAAGTGRLQARNFRSGSLPRIPPSAHWRFARYWSDVARRQVPQPAAGPARNALAGRVSEHPHACARQQREQLRNALLVSYAIAIAERRMMGEQQCAHAGDVRRCHGGAVP